MDFSYIIIPIIVLISSQALKLLTDGIKGNFDLKNFFISYGGMPSSHTAFAVSITTLMALRQGLDSPIFGVALIFTLLVMRDATSFRNLLGRQARLLNKYIDSLTAKEKTHFTKFQERMGHTYLEVLGGLIWGITLTYYLSLLVF
ncbi:MAG: divergent PAP2 family protein [Candidatus Buchananbacteria bacterium]